MSKLVAQLKRHEGVKSHVYKCTQGFETIGVGRNISESGLGLSPDEIDYLLHNDLERCHQELQEAYYWYGGLNKDRRDAMVDMCFNLGITRLRGFVNALEAMSREQFDIAADEFMDSRWAKQVGRRAEEVTEMIRTGEYR